MKDTALKEALFDVIEVGVLLRASNNKSTSLQGIYRDLRNSGVEVDIETVGFIYNEIFQGEPGFTSEEDIDIITTRAYRDAVNRMAENEMLVGEKQISEQPAETAVATLLVNALYENIVDDQRTVSDQRVLQNALWKGARRIVGKLDSKKEDPKSMQELIDQALGWEKVGIVDLNGRLNSISDLFYAMREKIREAADDIRNEAPDQDTIDRFDAYINGLENATYKLLFSRQEAKQVLTGAMKAAGFAKTLKNGNTVIDWNKLAGNAGNISDLRDNVDAALTKAGYPPAVIERVKDTLAQEFIDLRADIVDRQMRNQERFATEGTRDVKEEAGLTAMLAGRTIDKWIKDEKVENVEELEARANAALSGKTYEPEVISKIVDNLTDFFKKNYAKVATAEAQRAIDDILDGYLNALDWIKKNGIQNKGELEATLNDLLAARSISPQNADLIRKEFERILDIDNRAEKDLVSREKKAAQEYSPKKSDIQRMIELYHLGVFNRSHDELLFRLLGVNQLQADDIHDLEQLAMVASDLSRKLRDDTATNKFFLGDDVFASREFQRLQRHIDSIITRNINNKSKLLKILTAIKNFLDVMLSSLLGMPPTIVQNILSGVQAVFTGMRTGGGGDFLKKSKQSFQIYRAMLNHVGKTGQSYGEEIGSFANQELFTNSLKWNWGPGSTVKDKALSILYAGTAVLRMGLLAFDSANKVALTNKVFYNTVLRGLIAKGMTQEDAIHFMNDMLYGQKFEEAKALAKEIIDMNNAKLDPKFRSKAGKFEVITLANDIVKANLNMGKKIDATILSAALKSSYHVAGLGLGHEPNNPFSTMVKTYRDKLRNSEKKFVQNKDWKGLALHRMRTVVINTFYIRFAGGATNWLWLRAKHGLGLGIVSGFLGKWNSKVDFADARSMKEQMLDREKARNDIARGLIGGAYTGLAYAIGYGLVGGGSGDDDKERLEYLKKLKKTTDSQKAEIEELEVTSSVYREIKSDVVRNRWFKALAPDLMLLNYYRDNSKDGSLTSGIIGYGFNTYFGSERFGPAAKLTEATKLAYQGDYEGAWGTVMSMAGDQFSVPLWRNYKEYSRMLGNPFHVQPHRYEPPANAADAFFAGGMLEDIGIYDKKNRITMVPGIGIKSYNRFKEAGISEMKDVKENPLWYMRKDKDGFILDSRQRRQAKKFTEDYLEEQ